MPFAIDVWKAGAPSRDFLSPDIYFDDYVRWASEYRRPDNALFVPEAPDGQVGAANALCSFGARRGRLLAFRVDGESYALAGDVSVGVGSGGDRDATLGALYGQLQ